MGDSAGGVRLEPFDFIETRAGHIIRDYRREATRRYGPVVGSLIRPLAVALTVGAADGYAARVGRRTVGLLCHSRYGAVARITFCHVLGEFRGQGIEESLVRAAFRRWRAGTEPVERVVCEVMSVSHPDPDAVFRDLGFAVVSRMMMSAQLPRRMPRPAAQAVVRLRGDQQCTVRGWHRGDEVAAAHVIRAANRDTIDGLIYPELVSEREVRMAVEAIVRGSSGRFDGFSSAVTADPMSGEVAGVALCSQVPGRHGFLTELAVRPNWQGKGVGAALLDRLMQAMAYRRRTTVDLAVTASNRVAVSLYKGRGFQPGGSFSAYYWPQ